MVLILVVPIIGPMIYFAVRRPTSHEVDQKYLADRALQRSRVPAGRRSRPRALLARVEHEQRARAVFEDALREPLRPGAGAPWRNRAET